MSKDTLVIVIGEPLPEGYLVDIWQLEAMRDKAIAKAGSEAVSERIKKYSANGLNGVMVKHFDSLYADLKELT